MPSITSAAAAVLQVAWPRRPTASNACLTIEPAHQAALWNRSFLYLLQGDFDNGWRHFHQCGEYRRFEKPRWNGSALAGKTILIYSDSKRGLGDTIQNARYLPLVKERGGKVVLACQPGRYSGFWPSFRGSIRFDFLRDEAAASNCNLPGDDVRCSHCRAVGSCSVPRWIRFSSVEKLSCQPERTPVQPLATKLQPAGNSDLPASFVARTLASTRIGQELRSLAQAEFPRSSWRAATRVALRVLRVGIVRQASAKRASATVSGSSTRLDFAHPRPRHK